ncbi:tRNA (adenosine(37)-N6)-threonylcarbamoyltransferase complex dimerization subunit type 1 TsaB [Mycoplasmatota bacterium zrk1]
MKLFIDTATKFLYVALIEEGIVDLVSKIGNNDHSKTLMVEIEEMFVRNNISIKDIDEIIVGEGPGSYTGVRIGVVVAKTFAHFNNIKLKKVSTLEVLASTFTGKVAVMVDARRGHVFSAVYDVDNDYLVIIEPKMRLEEDFKEEVKGIKVVTIDNANIRPNLLKTTLVENVHAFSPNYLREWGE